MKILVNGEPMDLPQDSITVLELLKRCEVEMPDMVSVQLNGDFIDKARYGDTRVRDNDEVDFLYFMGGGNG